MSKCILCGSKAVINQQDNAGRVIYNCPMCGVYVISDLVEKIAKLHAAKISSFLMNRKLRGMNDIVFISFEKNKVDKGYLQMTVEQIIDLFPKTYSGQLEGALENLSMKSAYPGDEIRIERQESAAMFYVQQSGIGPMSFNIQALQELGWISVSFFGNSLLPCTIKVTPKGWEHLDEMAKGDNQANTALFSVPKEEFSDKFEKDLRKACNHNGLKMLLTATLRQDGKLGHEQIAAIKGAKVVACDLSNTTGEGYALAGMAMSLKKPCILLCSDSRRKSLQIDNEQVRVLFYQNEEMFLNKTIQAIQAII